ncbi:MAG TPA: hypothetical protein VHM31_09075 [Polyangia bacterium]|nr:hypothetical protein [Polyangia bacterium]
MSQPPSFSASLSRDRVEALARKYRRLVDLRGRRDGDGSGPAATRAELRALAAEFPGALRELDTLGAAELRRRAEACAAAAAGGGVEPWMAWIDRFHGLMRRALQARARGAGADPFECAVLAPPEGRMMPLVLGEVAAAFGEPLDRVAATLFPSRRPRL